MSQTVPSPLFDPFAPGFTDDPYPQYAAVRGGARLETSIALARLTARFPGLALDGEVTWNGRINLRGPAHLPVSLSAGR